MSEVGRASFVVRAVLDEQGAVSGVVERVATGAKEAFSGMESIGVVIVKMLHGASALPPAGPDPSPAGGENPDPGPLPLHGSAPNVAVRQTKESTQRNELAL
jgi:hypothetical protein